MSDSFTRKRTFTGRTLHFLLGFFVFSAVWLTMTGGRVQAVGAPTTTYPDNDQVCNFYPDGSPHCLTAGGSMMYLSVGVGEHFSGTTTVEIYPNATGVVSGTIENAAFCTFPLFPPGPNPTFDFDSYADATPSYRIMPGSLWSGVPAATHEAPASAAGCSSLPFSFNAVAGVTYTMEASVTNGGRFNENKENQFRVRVDSGNATLGAGQLSAGGISIANTNLPQAGPGQPSAYSTYAMHFAPVSCVTDPTNPVRFFDADVGVGVAPGPGVYQSNGAAAPAPFYPALQIRLLERVRGSGLDWASAPVALQFNAQGTTGTYESNAPYVRAGYEYRLEFIGLSRPNAIEVLLPDGVSQSVVETACPSAGAVCPTLAAPPAVNATAGATNYVITVQLRNSGSVNWTTADYSLRSAVGQTNNYLTTNGIVPSPLVASWSPAIDTPPGGTATFSYTIANVPLVPNIYPVFWQMFNNSSGTWFGEPCGVNMVVSAPAPTEFRPWVQINAGDVSAGGFFTDSASGFTTGATEPNAPIAAFNNLAGGGYTGSGTQLAAFDLGSVIDFASAQPIGVPKKLTFGNSGAGAAGTLFGGNAGAVPFMDNYFDSYDKTGLIDLPNYNVGHPTNRPAVPDGQITRYYHSGGPITLNPSTGFGNHSVREGQRTIFYVEGDVYIENNIGYDGAGSWANKNRIPAFYLVVKGNIYIDSNVTELNGVYIAQPNDVTTPNDSTGRIFTCASGGIAAPPDSVQLASTAVCAARQLVVNGAFLAQEVKLQRTIGDVSNGAAPGGVVPAEVFNFYPDTWLGSPEAPNTTIIEGYDSITTLPPVL